MNCSLSIATDDIQIWFTSITLLIGGRGLHLARQVLHSLILDRFDPVWKFLHLKVKGLKSYLTTRTHIWTRMKKNGHLLLACITFPRAIHTIQLKHLTKNGLKKVCLEFLSSFSITLANFSESSLLHSVCRFIYRTFSRRQVKATLGENVAWPCLADSITINKNVIVGTVAETKVNAVLT